MVRRIFKSEIFMSNLDIAGHSLAAGKTIKDHIHVRGTEIHIPHVVLCGKKPGKTVVITAGIHNAEYIGIQAAIELSQEIEPDDISGNIVIIPLVNRSGFENRTMSYVYEDGKNLNRVFPGNEDGTVAEKLAKVVFDEFIIHADAYIDLHCGDGFETLEPYIYYVGEAPCKTVAKEMTDCVDTKYRVRSRCISSGAYNEASMRGIPSVLIERGQLSLIKEEEVKADKRDVVNILRYLGVLEGQHDIYPKIDILEYSNDAPATGCWYPKMKVGDSFREGDIFGEIRDYFGKVIHTAVATEDGVLIHQCSSLSIIKDGPMVTYGVAIQPQ